MDKIETDFRSMAIYGSGQRAKGQKIAGAEIKEFNARADQTLEDVQLDYSIIKRIQKNVGRRNTEYKPEYAQIALRLLMKVDQCTTMNLIVAVLGTDDTTIRRWITLNEDFAQAIAYGKAIQEVQFGNILLKGFRYARSVEYILSNLHNWTNKKEETHNVIDLNKEIIERETFAASHRVRKRIDWEEIKNNAINTEPTQ